jgi:sugar phosphate isomerase/epimerase
MPAIKIFDGAPGSPDAVVAGKLLAAIARRDAVGVEMANYSLLGHADPKTGKLLLDMAPERKTVHLRHDSHSLLELVSDAGRAPADGRPVDPEAAMARLEADVALAAAHGVGGGAVIHVARTAAVPFVIEADGTKRELPIRGGAVEPAALAAALVIERLGEIGPLFVENTFEDVEWFERFLAATDAIPRKLLGLCLDVGHAKLWGGGKLSDWIDLIAKTKEEGRPIHAHVHMNRGKRDDHLRLFDGYAESLDQPSEFHPFGFTRELRRLATLCPSAQLVLENSTEGALDNLEFVERLIG